MSLTPGSVPLSPLPPTAVEWRDRLVELHVLAEHGDAAAAASAEGWMAVDDAAHRAWHAIEKTCHELRGGGR